MKKFYFKLPKLQILVLFMLISNTGLFAQQVITKYSQVNPESPFKYEHHFDESRYTKVLDEVERKVFLQNIPAIQNAPDSDNEILDISLSLNLNFDPNQYQAPSTVLVYDSSGHIYYAFWEGENPVTLDVPSGIYDIFVEFTHNDGKSNIIIKEQQNFQENSNVEINASDATNYVSLNLYDENGNLLEPGILNSESGISSQVFFDRYFIFNPLNTFISSIGYQLTVPFEEDPLWNFYINDISNSYNIINTFIADGFEQGSYFTKLQNINGINESISLENNPETWIYHHEGFQPSLLGEDGVFPGFSTLATYDNITLGGWTVYNSANTISPDDAFRGYIDNSEDDSLSRLLVSPAILDYSATISVPWPLNFKFFIKGNFVDSDGNDGLGYGSGGFSFNPFPTLPFLGLTYYLTEDGYKILPSHSKFTFSTNSSPNILQGNNVPITITAFKVVSDQENIGLYQYKGRYGEIRESDFFATDVEVRQTGDIIFTGNFMDDFVQFNMPTNGQLEITLMNNNIQVEGLPGKNTTKITYNAGQEDAPPTLQHLQFRNVDGEVTDRFASVSEGTVRLAAGDFQYNFNSSYYDYTSGNTIEFYYSLYDQNNWTELELTEYPEYFQMPAFGDYYEGSLAGVVVPEDNTWFDVKIVCTDAAGNKQEQIISPAFKVEQATMGVEEVNQSGFTVYPNPFTNELNVQLPENVKSSYTFKVSDLTGKTIYAQTQSEKSFVWNGSSLPKGVYILSIESNGKTIAKKVIKK